jgi:hypothetical protein
MSALSPKRAVTITYNAEAIADGGKVMKLVGNFVDEYEAKYALDPSGTPDIGAPATTTAVSVLISGQDVNTLHVFDVYADVSAGTYNFNYVETVPNAESVS